MNRASLIILVILLIIAVGGYYWLQQGDINTTNSAQTAPPSVQPTEKPSEVTTLKEDGTTYEDPQGIFSVTYPSDYQLDEPADGQMRLIKRGEMQRPQSEISDGVLLVFETLVLEGKSLEEVVDERIATTTQNGTGEILQPKTAVTINSHPGFSYTVGGFGSSKQVFLQKDPSSQYAIVIAVLVEDPKDAGYQQQVDTILSSIEFKK